MRNTADWAIHRIESEYKDDVCILVEHKTFRLAADRDENSFCFYVPATSRANGLARTFIIGGIGYDLFPMSWERIERIADVKDYLITCLADAEVLYSRNDGDRQRFTSLQARLRANLRNPQFVHSRALERLSTAVGLYQEMLFEDELYRVRTKAGDICIILSMAVALINHQYLPYGQTDQIKELSSMDEVPAGFTDLYERIVLARSADEQKRLCHEIIVSTKTFLAEHDTFSARRTSAPDFSELADWYQELSYTWRRVRHFCDANEPVNAYMWCCLLQNELDEVGEEYGITGLDVFGAYDPENLPAFRERADLVEQRIVAAIEANGVAIDSYPTMDDFLERNP